MESQRVVEGRGVVWVHAKEEEAWEHQITVLAWVVEDLLTAEATPCVCGVVWCGVCDCVDVNGNMCANTSLHMYCLLNKWWLSG